MTVATLYVATKTTNCYENSPDSPNPVVPGEGVGTVDFTNIRPAGPIFDTKGASCTPKAVVCLHKAVEEKEK